MAATGIAITELTNGVLSGDRKSWAGTGVFDVLINAVSGTLATQFELGYLKGTDYAAVYTQAITACIQQSVMFLVQQRDMEDKLLTAQAQRDLLSVQTVSEETKIDLMNRQIKGFDDDAIQKLIKSQLDSWAVLYSTNGTASLVPDSVTEKVIDNTMKTALDRFGIPTAVDNLE